MTDYTKATGSNSTMMVRVNATTVQFFLKSSSGTFNHELPWGYTVNGVTDTSNIIDYVGNGSYILFATFNVTTSQTVTFRLYDSNTSGIGGPTTLSVAVDRAGPPPAPDAFVINSISSTVVTGDFNSNGNGGAAIDLLQVGLGTSPTAPTQYRTANAAGSATITGLAPGTLYYFWARLHNSEGYSPLSPRTYAHTWDVPPAPTTPVLSNVGQFTVDARFASNGTGGGTWQPANTGYEIGYGTSPTAPTTIIAADGIDTITGLTPGTTYYFWARSKNTVGVSAWSARSTATTLAGAWVLVGDVWKKAVPYVNVNGVWKPAQTWVKIAGLWKPTG